MNKLHLAMVYLNGLIELLSSNKLVLGRAAAAGRFEAPGAATSSSAVSRVFGCKITGLYITVFYCKIQYFIPPYRILLRNMRKKQSISQHYLLAHLPLPIYFH